jgi:hypothetical protein
MAVILDYNATLVPYCTYSMRGLLVHVIQITHLVEEHRNRSGETLIRFLSLEIPGRYCRVLRHQRHETLNKNWRIPPTTKSQTDLGIRTNRML